MKSCDPFYTKSSSPNNDLVSPLPRVSAFETETPAPTIDSLRSRVAHHRPPTRRASGKRVLVDGGRGVKNVKEVCADGWQSRGTKTNGRLMPGRVVDLVYVLSSVPFVYRKASEAWVRLSSVGFENVTNSAACRVTGNSARHRWLLSVVIGLRRLICTKWTVKNTGSIA